MISKVDAFLDPEPRVSAQMSKQRTRDTQPEVAFRRLLHARGFRFRIHYPVPGASRRSIDVAFPRRKIAVFIDGCYWHGCDLHKSIPKKNAESWSSKIAANRARDVDTDERLANEGWKVFRYWEHDAPSLIVDAVMRHVGLCAQQLSVPLADRGEYGED